MKQDDETSVSNLELLNYVIAFQLQKIVDYQKTKDSKKSSAKITSYSEEAMKNLINLLEIRTNIK